jgi:hypothetical protein
MMRKLIILLFFAGSLQWVCAQNAPPAVKYDSLHQEKLRYATDSLQQIIRFSEDLLRTVKNAKTNAEKQVEKMRDYLWNGSDAEAVLARNFSRLYPKNETMKNDLVQRFHFIMHSLALYRADLRNAGYRETGSSKKEYEYLVSRIPAFVNRLKHIITNHR